MDSRFNEQCYCGDCWRCGFYEETDFGDETDFATKPVWSDHFNNDREAGIEAEAK